MKKLEKLNLSNKISEAEQKEIIGGCDDCGYPCFHDLEIYQWFDDLLGMYGSENVTTGDTGSIGRITEEEWLTILQTVSDTYEYSKPLDDVPNVNRYAVIGASAVPEIIRALLQ